MVTFLCANDVVIRPTMSSCLNEDTRWIHLQSNARRQYYSPSCPAKASTIMYRGSPLNGVVLELLGQELTELCT
jgi:hypothetical protein